MKIEFNQIIKELNIPANESEIIFERLIECYSESHRDYHNLRHIREMLECIKLHKEDISDYPLLYISCLYHDIVYDTHASDNEEKSAEYLERDFKKYLPKEKIEKGNYWKDVYDINKQIEDIEKVIKEQKVNSIKEQLFKDGVQFTKAAHIQLKFNYIPQLKGIKLAQVGKSGKKATALLTHFHGGYVSTEQNVNVVKVIEQVLGYSNIVAEPEMA